MIHIYSGRGKGKTTAASGAALRAAGHGVPVLFAQFLKDGLSGEAVMLSRIPGVLVLHAQTFGGFLSRMTEEELSAEEENCREFWNRIQEASDRLCSCFPCGNGDATEDLPDSSRGSGDAEIRCLIVLDEILHVTERGWITEDEILDYAGRLPEDAEIVLTGRKAPEKLAGRADYFTEFVLVRHPYQRGIAARKGVEK